MLILFVVCLCLFVLGNIPIGFALVLTSVVLLLYTGNSLLVLPQNLLSGVDNFPLMAIPFFILAGELMNEGGLSLAIVRFVKALMGHIKGGLGYVAVVASMLFAGVSGSAIADTSAIGSVLLPLMEQEKYDKDRSTALICSAGCVGPIIPPSIPMVLFGVIGGVSITKMFLGGIVPGVITGVFLMFAWYFMTRRRNLPVSAKASLWEVVVSAKDASVSLMLPVIMMGGMLSGVFTPTEAAVVAVVYAFVVTVLIYRRLTFGQIRKIFLKSARASAVVMFICGAANALAYLITVARIPQMLGDYLTSVSANRFVIMLIINGIILIVGCFMDVAPALLILGPILLTVVQKMGFDPIYFGVILVYGLCLGLITPPVGTVLYVGCGISGIGLMDLLKRIYPLVFVYILVLLLITLFPQLIMFIPNHY